MDASSGLISEGLAQVLPIETNEVFYNPAQVFNRDLSILLASLFVRERFGLLSVKTRKGLLSEDGPVRVLEGLAASGLRSIRYAKELRFGKFEIFANDIESVAAERMRKNFAFNEVEVGVLNEDAVRHMYVTPQTYHVIDLDPYGSASIFLDAALFSVVSGGLLCITCTDGGVLCGNQPSMAFSRYGGFSLKKKYAHEMGLRVMLLAIHSAAARHRRGIRVLASFSIDFYFRVFVQVFDSPEKSLENLQSTALVLQCVGCEYFTVQPLASAGGKPGRLLCTNECPECASALSIGGPMWAGPIYDPEFVDLALELKTEEFPGISSWTKIRGLLTGLKSELVDVPLFYTIPGLVQTLKCSPPKLGIFGQYLTQLGYRVGASHRVPNSVKTDAPPSVVYDLLRMHVAIGGHAKETGEPLVQNGEKFMENDELIRNDDLSVQQSAETSACGLTVAQKLVSKPITTVMPDELELDFHQASKPARTLPVYMPNPTPFWGPKPAAKKSRT